MIDIDTKHLFRTNYHSNCT